MRFRLSFLILGWLPLATALFADPAMTLLPASDARYRYEGRIYAAQPTRPVLIWSGTRVAIDFAGDRLALQFGPIEGQCVFNVTVNGVTEIADLRSGSGARYVWPHALPAGRHRLELFKRSEASKGHVTFHGIEISPEAEVWAAAGPEYRLKMEFLGDSITVGACNEDGATDQWDDYRTHNYALSWAHLTAGNFHADDRVAAYSGMGVITGWEKVRAGKIWDKIYPQEESVRQDFKTWQADVVFVNWGENDSSFTEAQKQPFPQEFAAGYVEVVKAIRAAYPQAQIVLLRGGMTGGARDPDYRTQWDLAVGRLEAADARITHYAFTHFSALHPRVADDRILADELTAWLKQQPFMTQFR